MIGKLRKALGPRAAAATRARSRSAPAPATSRSTCCAPAWSARRWRPTSRPGCSAGSSAPPRSSGWRVETAACEAAELPFEDDSFDLVFGHAVLHHLPDLRPRSASSGACCGRAAWSPSAASRPTTATASRRGRSAARMRGGAAVASADAAPRPRPARTATSTAAGARRTGSSRWSTCTRSRPPSSPATPAAAGFDDVRVSGEELAAGAVRLGEPHARGDGGPARRAVGLARVRLPRLPAAADAGPLAARAAPARGALLQPAASRRARRPSAALSRGDARAGAMRSGRSRGRGH